MNCDTCAYRIAMPGFADKLGRPQTPHHHPDDDGHDHSGQRHPPHHPATEVGHGH
jgi:sirohydrochlorin cobaltochelatase